jgi:hypothetical protein
VFLEDSTRMQECKLLSQTDRVIEVLLTVLTMMESACRGSLVVLVDYSLD